MRNKEEIHQAINLIFREVLQLPDLELALSTTAEDIEQWDSLNHAILMSEIQSKFNTKFALRDILTLKDVNDICELLLQKH